MASWISGRPWSLPLAALAILLAAPATADVMNFERSRVLPSADNLVLDETEAGNPFARLGVRFTSQRGLVVERAGSPGSATAATEGFATGGGFDQDAGVLGRLGRFFLRGAQGAAGAWGGDPSQPFFSIHYPIPAIAAISAEIWDIDSSTAGTESWRIEARDMNGDLIQTVTSPTGGLDGLPWRMQLTPNSHIVRLDFMFTGTKTAGIDFGFDNFETGIRYPTPAPSEVPAPGALALFGLALAGLVAARRRRT